MRILKIESLPSYKNWIDRDELMLHSCFQILKDCVEKEDLLENTNYEEHKELVDEIKYLYEWWEHRSALGESDENTKQDDEMLMRLMKVRGSLWT